MIQSSKRINWIDWAKALGIILVVLGHLYYPPGTQYILRLIYGFHMPFFILISGYLHRQETGFVKKNFRRLIIPYLSFNLIFSFVFYIQKNTYEFESLDRTFLQNMFVFPISEPTWFLLALFWIKIMSQYLLNLKVYFAIPLSILIAILGYILYNCVGDGIPSLNRIPFFICQSLILTPFFVVGYYLKMKNCMDIVYRKKNLLLLSILIFTPIYLIGVYKSELLDYHNCILSNNPINGAFISSIGCYLFLLFCRFLNAYTNEFIQRISFGSIVVLGIHLNISRDILKLLSSSQVFFICLLIFILVFIFCYYLIGFVQKNKLLSFLFMGRSIK